MSAVLTANSEAAQVLLVKGFTPYSSLIARAIDSANPKFREPARQTKVGPEETDRPPDGNPPHETGRSPGPYGRGPQRVPGWYLRAPDAGDEKPFPHNSREPSPFAVQSNEDPRVHLWTGNCPGSAADVAAWCTHRAVTRPMGPRHRPGDRLTSCRHPSAAPPSGGGCGRSASQQRRRNAARTRSGRSRSGREKERE